MKITLDENEVWFDDGHPVAKMWATVEFEETLSEGEYIFEITVRARERQEASEQSASTSFQAKHCG